MLGAANELRRTRPRWVGLLFAALVLCSACASSGSVGKGSAASFDHDLTAATTSFRARTEQIKADGRAALATADKAKVLAIYESLRDATAAAAKRYHELTPPAAKAADFRAFVDNIDKQKTALDGVVQGAKKQQGAAVAAGLRSYAALLSQWAAALARLGGDGSSGTTG